MKVRKCYLENCGIYIFRLEYLVLYFKRFYEKKYDDVKKLVKILIIKFRGSWNNNVKVRVY